MSCCKLLCALVVLAPPCFITPPTAAEDIFRETFDRAVGKEMFINVWGDKPVKVDLNGAWPGVGRGGSSGGWLRLVFGGEARHNLSYWSFNLKEPVPIIPEMKEISFWVKANVPVLLKVAISPYGFIYHAPGYSNLGEWEQVRLTKAFDELKAWCERGGRAVAGGFVSGIIVAIAKTKDVAADVVIDDIAITGARGALEAARKESFRRKVRKVRVSVVSQIWSDEGRTLEKVLEKIDEAALDGADIVALPQECVKTDGEPIPGAISNAIAERAKMHHMWVIGNIREKDGGRTYVTSFLCDRNGSIVGKYRKSHKMPDEDMDLGDDLPIFKTELGTIAMRIGTDRFFPEIDHVYSAKGASIIFWAQMPEPVEDEFSQDFPCEGRAVDYNVFIACSRYAFAKPGYITNMYPPYCGCPIGRAYIVNREGQRIASTPRTGGGVATATIPYAQLLGDGRRPNRSPAFAAIAAPKQLPDKKQFAKRKIRVTIIESHLSIQDLLKKLDEAGKMGSDIVCLYEFVWIAGPDKKQIEEMTKVAKANLAKVAAKAKQWKMYILIAGVVDRIERNEAIIFDRNGEILGRYYKIAKTHDEQICGDETPVFETDFGRIAARICADEWMVELDRCYGIKGVDVLFTPTQSWGPDALFRDLRDISRAMDNQFFLVECTHPSTELRHRSIIVEPTGAIVASSEYRKSSIVSAVIDLDNNRPLRYIRDYKPHKPGGYLPEYQPEQMPSAANDLKEVLLQQRRPELYGVLAVTPTPSQS